MNRRFELEVFFAGQQDGRRVDLGRGGELFSTSDSDGGNGIPFVEHSLGLQNIDDRDLVFAAARGLLNTQISSLSLSSGSEASAGGTVERINVIELVETSTPIMA